METVEAGWNRLVGVGPESILAAWHDFSPPAQHPPVFGDGTAGERIAAILERMVETWRGAEKTAPDGAPGLWQLQPAAA